MDDPRNGASRAWPETPWQEWADCLATIHLWTQMVGKVRTAVMPPASHWWHSALVVSARGLTTGAMPWGERLFQVDLDLVAHRLVVTESGGRERVAPLVRGMSVARFYAELMAALGAVDCGVRFRATPVEVPTPIPFPDDEVHAAYEPELASAFFGGLGRAQRLLSVFAARFVGKVSPVQFSWGSFDLSASRFSGRRAPLHPGVPGSPAWVMQEAYSHELCTVGWWPTSRELGPAFYAFHYPEPEGYRDAALEPPAARWDSGLREFILREEDVLGLADADASVLAFFETAYARGADLAGWRRHALEPDPWPATGQPTRAWSTTTDDLLDPAPPSR